MHIGAAGHLDIETFDKVCTAKSPGRVVVDLESAESLDVYALVAIACVAMRSAAEESDCGFLPPRRSAVKRYLGAMGLSDFLAMHGKRCQLDIAEPENHPEVLVRLEGFSDMKAVNRIEELIFEQLDQRVTGGLVQPLTEAVVELATNVIQHSKSRGVVAVQLRDMGRRGHRLELAIGDAGIGIRESFVIGGYDPPPPDDLEAIRLAESYLVTSTGQPGRGVGLYQALKDTRELKGGAVIRTGAGRRRISPKGATDLRVFPLQGTMVALSIPCS